MSGKSDPIGKDVIIGAVGILFLNSIIILITFMMMYIMLEFVDWLGIGANTTAIMRMIYLPMLVILYIITNIKGLYGLIKKHYWISSNLSLSMPKRKCDICGKETEVYGGKVCPNGHFACKACSSNYGSKCKICGKQMVGGNLDRFPE